MSRTPDHLLFAQDIQDVLDQHIGTKLTPQTLVTIQLQICAVLGTWFRYEKFNPDGVIVSIDPKNPSCIQVHLDDGLLRQHTDSRSGERDGSDV